MRLRDNCARALLPLSALLLQGVFKKSCAVEDMRGEDGEDGREHFLSMQRASISYVCSAWKCECWGVARVHVIRTCCGCAEAFLVGAPRGSVMRTGNHIKRVSVSPYLLAVLDDHHTTALSSSPHLVSFSLSDESINLIESFIWIHITVYRNQSIIKPAINIEADTTGAGDLLVFSARSFRSQFHSSSTATAAWNARCGGTLIEVALLNRPRAVYAMVLRCNV